MVLAAPVCQQHQRAAPVSAVSRQLSDSQIAAVFGNCLKCVVCLFVRYLLNCAALQHCLLPNSHWLI